MVAKIELLQLGGSFKVRGAFNKLLQLGEAERKAGVVAVSGGNHGIAVALAAVALNIPATVLMPTTTSQTSIAAAAATAPRLCCATPSLKPSTRPTVVAGLRLRARVPNSSIRLMILR